VDSDYIFVYGTLRTQGAKSIFRTLTRLGIPVGAAHLKAALFNLGPYPGAVCDAKDESFVRGEVYRIRDRTQLLAELDAYEGCGPEHPVPTEFRREVVEVVLDNGDKLKAWAYLYSRSTNGLKRIESGDYLEFIKQGER
jgi:gamma-glutamylcyclotransferase (GGCT)/AIG2-like uncharacterized protein YtfP